MDIFGSIGHLIMGSPWTTAGVVAAAIGGMIYYFHKATLDFWLMDAWYMTPIFGRLAQLSRRKVRAADRAFEGWLQSEVTLGSDYANHISPLSPEAFALYRSYLGLADDGGREPLPGWLLAVLVVLVGAEAFGISFLMAGGLARNMSANAQLIGAGAIVVVICIVLVCLTHAAGKHLRRNLLIGECEDKYDEAVNAADPNDPRAIHRKPLATHDRLEINQSHLDENDPDYSRCINRIGQGKTWFWVWGALAAILIFGAVQVELRVNDTLQKLTRNTIGLSADAGGAASPIPDFGDGADPLPAAIAAPDARAQAKAAAEVGSNEVFGSWTTSLGLAFIYLMTQLTGIYAGYSYGFAGAHSKQAYYETRGCKLYETYQQVERKLMGIADRRMQSLHQRMTDKAHGPLTFGGDFYSFLKIHRQRAQLINEAVAPAPASAPVGAGAPLELAALAAHLERLKSLPEPEMKAYIKALPPGERAAVMPSVPGLLAARDASSQDDAALDALFKRKDAAAT